MFTSVDQHLRTVKLDGFVLTTWDTYETDRLGKSILGYQLKGPDGEVIFEGEDFGCSPMHAIDSNEALRGILGFLTLQPGDTDDEYFEDYTPEQMEFAETHAEELSLWAHDDFGMTFEDVEPDAD
jgi:hypothetical protein